LFVTESQIACEWSYSRLRWKAENDDHFHDDDRNLLYIDMGAGQPRFYLTTVEAPIDDHEEEINIEFCQDVEWDEEDDPGEDNIEWETDAFSVEVYGRVFVELAAFSLRDGVQKSLY